MPSRTASRIRGILFDKDGTLIDFRSQWMPAYRAAVDMLSNGDEALARRLLQLGGYDPVSNHLDPASPLACGTNRQIVEVWAQGLGVPMTEPLYDRVQDIFHEVAIANAHPVTDLKALFGRLRARGIRIGVATMDSTATARANIEAFDIAELVDFAIGADAGHGVKPAPGMLLAFCAAGGFAPAEAAMVGDSVVDLMMGRNAKAGLVVGVTSGVTPRATLEPHADVVLDTVAQIEAALPEHQEVTSPFEARLSPRTSG
jgi:phosphoglycolate phosphatase